MGKDSYTFADLRNQRHKIELLEDCILDLNRRLALAERRNSLAPGGRKRG